MTHPTSCRSPLKHAASVRQRLPDASAFTSTPETGTKWSPFSLRWFPSCLHRCRRVEGKVGVDEGNDRWVTDASGTRRQEGRGEGPAELADEVERSATGEDVPEWKIDAPWWHWQADVTEVRVRVWEPSRLLTAAYLYLSDRCADRQLCTGNNSIMCVSFGPTWSFSALQRSTIYKRRFNHLFRLLLK